MRRKQWVLALLAVLFTGIAVHAQEKPAAEKRPPVPVTVQVVFSEFEGDKKISSLPYLMPINAEFNPLLMNVRMNQLRMGVRVPIQTAPQTMQYMDVGTNIDCHARTADGVQFEVGLQVERSSLYSPTAEGKQRELHPGEQMAIASQPIVRRYNSSMSLLMRDGQTVQRSLATDPVSGRTLRVDVTLNVVK